MTYRNPIDGKEMVLIPEGPAVFGSPVDDPDSQFDGRPQFTAVLPAYYLGIHCVTNAQYALFLNARRPERRELVDWLGLGRHCRIGRDRSGEHATAGPQYLGHPVVMVTWLGARAYCDWAGLRLPTELEWEKGARGSDGLVYPWGNEWNGDLCRHGLSRDEKGTCCVDAYPDGASHRGLLNMSGNVEEWCADRFDGEAYDRYAAGDLTALPEGETRAVRGGSWCHRRPVSFRCTYRFDGLLPGFRGNDLGFRCARDATD